MLQQTYAIEATCQARCFKCQSCIRKGSFMILIHNFLNYLDIFKGTTHETFQESQLPISMTMAHSIHLQQIQAWGLLIALLTRNLSKHLKHKTHRRKQRCSKCGQVRKKSAHKTWYMKIRALVQYAVLNKQPPLDNERMKNKTF